MNAVAFACRDCGSVLAVEADCCPLCRAWGLEPVPTPIAAQRPPERPPLRLVGFSPLAASE